MVEIAQRHAGRLDRPRSRLELRLILAGGFILFLVAIAIAAPWIAPHDPLDQDLFAGLLPPVSFQGSDPAYLLGTDDLGRDLLSRVIYGTRTALTVAVIATAIVTAVGSLLGLLAGWYGGWPDRIISRLVDIWMAFPPVLLSILLVAVLGAGLLSVIAAIAIVDWTRFTRVVRAETQAQAQLDYVVAARALGFSRAHILFREILVNVGPVLIGLISLEMGVAVIVEAILSFVGLSVSSDMPTWGGMIAQGRQIVHTGWWVLAAPLLALFITVLAFNQFGEGLRRAVDPVMRR